MEEPRGGPLPEVLARLADTTPAAPQLPRGSTAARVFGLVLLVATAAAVVAAAIVVGYP